MTKKIAVTIPEASSLTGLSRSRIYEFLGAELKAVKAGRRTLIRLVDLEAFMAALPSYKAGE